MPYRYPPIVLGRDSSYRLLATVELIVNRQILMKPIYALARLRSLVFSRGPGGRILDHVKLQEPGDTIFRQGFPCDRRRVYIFRQDCKVVALLATVSTIVHSLAIVSILDGTV
jgi:hypothetical protein